MIWFQIPLVHPQTSISLYKDANLHLSVFSSSEYWVDPCISSDIGIAGLPTGKLHNNYSNYSNMWPAKQQASAQQKQLKIMPDVAMKMDEIVPFKTISSLARSATHKRWHSSSARRSKEHNVIVLIFSQLFCLEMGRGFRLLKKRDSYYFTKNIFFNDK